MVKKFNAPAHLTFRLTALETIAYKLLSVIRAMAKLDAKQWQLLCSQSCSQTGESDHEGQCEPIELAMFTLPKILLVRHAVQFACNGPFWLDRCCLFVAGDRL